MRASKLFLYIAWFLAVGLLFVITMYNQNRVDSFLGLTESKETVLNLSFDLEIKKLYVGIGQKVKKGEKLAEVVRIDFNTKQPNDTPYKIQTLLAKNSIKKKSLEGEIKAIDMKKYQELSEIDAKIRVLRSERSMNKKLLKAIEVEQSNYSNSTINNKIRTLKYKKISITKVFDMKKSNILSRIENLDKPVQSQINALKARQLAQEKESDIFTLYAPYDGDISNVHYRETQVVKAFDSLITLHPLYPSYIKGYIHEDIQTEISVGESVLIYPANAQKEKVVPIMGKIKSISSRIVNFPIRLKKYKIVPLWGYKILIEVPKSDLKLGQKVVITRPLDENDKNAKIFQLLHSIKLH